MFNFKLTYANKNKLLLAGSVLMLILVYKLALKKTFHAIVDSNRLVVLAQAAEDAPVKSALLKRKLQEVDAQVNSEQADNENPRDKLLGVVTRHCAENKLVLRELPKTLGFMQSNFYVETNIFIIEGSFVKLLQLIYLLEQKKKISKVSSLNFQLKKDLKNQTSSLMLTIYLQNIKKLSHED